MSTTAILKLIIIGVCLVLFFYLNFTCPKMKHIPIPVTITEMAHRDLTYVGAYDDKMQVSLNIWLFHVLAVCYTEFGWVDVKALIREWENEIYDPDGLIRKCVGQSLKKFDKIVVDAKSNDTEPVFNISTKYNYHNLPSTLRCNDYCNLQYIISRLDDEIGGDEIDTVLDMG